MELPITTKSGKTHLGLIWKNKFKAIMYNYNVEEILNQKRNIMSCMIGVEGGHVIGDDITKVQYFYDRGMRYLGLTWNNSNSIASSAKDEF